MNRFTLPRPFHLRGLWMRRTRVGKRAATTRVRVPTVLQMEAVECGAASLAMILGYHGSFVPLEELRVACGVSRDGTKASSIVKAARSYGLVARGFSKELAGLRALPLPQIVFWDFNHFLVVEGFGPDRVYLNDPASGPRRVTNEEFDQAFTGVVLIFAPGPAFRPGGERPNALAGLRRRMRGAEWSVVGVLLLTLTLVVPALAVPSLTRQLVDRYLLDGALTRDTRFLLAFGGVALLSVAAIGAQRVALLHLELRLTRESAGAFFWHVLRLPIEFFTQRHAGEVGGRVHLNDTIARLLSGQLAATAFSLALLGFYAALMASYDPLLTVIALTCAALNLVALRAMARRRVEGSHRLLQEGGKLHSTTVTGLQLIETLKASGSEDDFFARWSGQQARLANARQELDVSTRTLAVVPTALASLASVAVLTVGAWQVMRGVLTVGTLVAFQALLAGFLGPVNRLVLFSSVLQEIGGSLTRLDDVLRYPLDRRWQAPTATGVAAKLIGHLELRHITFGYSRLDPPLLADFNLTIGPGQRIALIGGTGSGKSTVARLAAGLLTPWSGAVLLDGTPAEELPATALVGTLALVDQEIALFGGTVRDNLTLWDATVSEERLLAATRDAALHEELLARPGGYDAVVDEGGRNFSGGQRQRLELARALATDPALLILDEATSALDPLTEEAIMARLRQRGCACLIVAHRLSTIRDCDEIIVLDRGRIAQRGTHEALLRAGGLYSRLIAVE